MNNPEMFNPTEDPDSIFKIVEGDVARIGDDFSQAMLEAAYEIGDESLIRDVEMRLIETPWPDPDHLKRFKVIQPGLVKKIMDRSEIIHEERFKREIAAELAKAKRPKNMFKGILRVIRPPHL